METALGKEDVGRLIHTDKEQKMAHDDWLNTDPRRKMFLKIREELGEMGQVRKVEAQVLPGFVSEAVQILEEMNMRVLEDEKPSREESRVIATQLVLLYTLVATGRLDEMYERLVDRIRIAGEVIPKENSQEEWEKKIALAAAYVERVTQDLTGKDQVGIEIEYPHWARIAASKENKARLEGESGKLKITRNMDADELNKLENYYMNEDYVVDMLKVLGAWESPSWEGPKTQELSTMPGEWRAQIREIASLVSLGELQGREVAGRRTLSLHLTLPEVRLSENNTEVMWIAPMLMAMEADTVDQERVRSAVARKKLIRESVKKESTDSCYYPYHRQRLHWKMKRSLGGVELRSWLRVTIPEGEKGINELLNLYRAAEFTEGCREMLVAGQEHRDQNDRAKADVWQELNDKFRSLLASEGIRTPDEGEGEMYRGAHAPQIPTRYEKMIHDLRVMRVMEPEKWGRIKLGMNELRREAMRKLKETKA